MGRARRGALPLSNEWEVFWIGSGNWIVDNLNSALEMWNERLAEIWQLISISPEEFKGGGVWNVIVNINGALKAVGYALLVLFFVMGVVKTCGSFAEIKKPEVAFKCLIRFILAQAAVTWGMEIMTMLFRVAQGIVSTIMDSSGLSALSATELPSKMVSIIEDVGFLESIPLWAVTLLGSLFIWVLSLVMILTVYSRFFKLYMATAIAPIPLASFAGQPSSSIGTAFLKSYAAICLEGCVIVLACVIFSGGCGRCCGDLLWPAPGVGKWGDRLGVCPGGLSFCPRRLFSVQRHGSGTISAGGVSDRGPDPKAALVPLREFICNSSGSCNWKGATEP